VSSGVLRARHHRRGWWCCCCCCAGGWTPMRGWWRDLRCELLVAPGACLRPAAARPGCNKPHSMIVASAAACCSFLQSQSWQCDRQTRPAGTNYARQMCRDSRASTSLPGGAAAGHPSPIPRSRGRRAQPVDPGSSDIGSVARSWQPRLCGRPNRHLSDRAWPCCHRQTHQCLDSNPGSAFSHAARHGRWLGRRGSVQLRGWCRKVGATGCISIVTRHSHRCWGCCTCCGCSGVILTARMRHNPPPPP
jgi:hypothetical protein